MGLMGWLGLLITGGSIGLALIVLSMVFLSPTDLGPVGVTFWFVILLITLACGLSLALYGLKTYLALHASARQRLRYSLRQGWLVAAGITMVLALSSLRQLGWLDAILLGLILGIIEVYVRLRWP